MPTSFADRLALLQAPAGQLRKQLAAHLERGGEGTDAVVLETVLMRVIRYAWLPELDALIAQGVSWHPDHHAGQSLSALALHEWVHALESAQHPNEYQCDTAVHERWQDILDAQAVLERVLAHDPVFHATHLEKPEPYDPPHGSPLHGLLERPLALVIPWAVQWLDRGLLTTPEQVHHHWARVWERLDESLTPRFGNAVAGYMDWPEVTDQAWQSLWDAFARQGVDPLAPLVQELGHTRKSYFTIANGSVLHALLYAYQDASKETQQRLVEQGDDSPWMRLWHHALRQGVDVDHRALLRRRTTPTGAVQEVEQSIETWLQDDHPDVVQRWGPGRERWLTALQAHRLAQHMDTPAPSRRKPRL